MLIRRLAADRRLSRARRLSLFALLAYLALPFDLVPDFIPVVGLLDDAALVVLALRGVLRAAGPALIAEHWPGPAQSLDVVLRAAGASARTAGRSPSR